MELLTIFILAIGLSFDSFAVSVSTGIYINQIEFRPALKFSMVLGILQGLFPIVGWVAGSGLHHIVADYDHWVAFILLSMLGTKMVYESFQQETNKQEYNPLKLTTNIGIGIATSIDALIVGISLAFISLNIIVSAAIIGSVTVVACMVGLLLGKKIGNKLGRRVEIIGGILLIIIGLKILLLEA